MAARTLISGLFFIRSCRSFHPSFHYSAINRINSAFFISSRNFQNNNVLWKRRKTAEERKSTKIIEYSPKKKHHENDENRVIDIWRHMTVQDLANSMDKDLEQVQEAMLYVKSAPDIDPKNRLEDPNLIKEIVSKFGMRIKIVAAPSKEDEHSIEKDRDIVRRPPPAPENLKPRFPVVTVMGHVDHGKTTLLDSLRGASVALSEAGGITQHIGAFTVELENGEKMTFLDTPGHAAFSAMRARGANITDIIVLVVAADDGVMEQTKEVVKLAQAENVPIIVAINKIDKPEADVERTKRGLAQLGVALEGYGGETQFVCISAKEGTNLQELAEAVSTQATLMGLKGEFVGPVEGVVVESSSDSKRGKLSTAIVTRGTLRKGAILVSGQAWAKVRAMFNHAGKPMDFVEPGNPVEILGWRELPIAGDEILEVDSEKHSHSVLRWRHGQALKEKAEHDLENIRFKQLEHDEQYKQEREARRLAGKFKTRRLGPRQKEIVDDDRVPRVNVVIKGDVHGSVEAILDVLETYHDNEKCRLDIVHYGVGDVNESDLEFAKTFNAIIYAFSVSPTKSVPKGIKLKEVNIIYRLVDDLKQEINAKLPPIDVEEVVGEANILQLFEITDHKKEVLVLGCRCTKGILKKSYKFKVVRNGEVLFDGQLNSMRHLKNEVDSVKKDIECGLRLENLDVEVKSGDTLVCYNIIKKPMETDWDPGF